MDGRVEIPPPVVEVTVCSMNVVRCSPPNLLVLRLRIIFRLPRVKNLKTTEMRTEKLIEWDGWYYPIFGPLRNVSRLFKHERHKKERILFERTSFECRSKLELIGSLKIETSVSCVEVE